MMSIAYPPMLHAASELLHDPGIFGFSLFFIYLVGNLFHQLVGLDDVDGFQGRGIRMLFDFFKENVISTYPLNWLDQKRLKLAIKNLVIIFLARER